MKFYNREKELASLEKVRQVSFSVHSQMTVLTGRRRIGKTSLIFKSCEDTPTVYLFVSRSNEADLCLRFTSEIRQALDIYVPELTNFAEMFRFLMDLGTRMEYNLVIDEFQEFYYINQEIYRRHVLYCPDKKLYSFTLDGPALRQLGQAAEVYVAAQLERSFRTLDYYKSILPQEEPTYD